jgi:hypothetical protein
MYRIFIKTRGKTIDYEFILKFPEDYWWEDYRKFTSKENPTLIIKNISDTPRIYLSGIPSKRKDIKQRIIRYTLVIELTDATDNDKDAFIKLVSIWLNEVKTATENPLTQSDIGSLLDEQFPDTTVEKLLDQKSEESEVREKLNTGLKGFREKLSHRKLPIEPDYLYPYLVLI